jgi:hypothetical protein
VAEHNIDKTAVVTEIARRNGWSNERADRAIKERWQLRLLLRLAAWLNKHSGTKRWT